MTPEYAKPERIHLKTSSDFSEKWLQTRITEDPTILGLGDVELVALEKVHPKAGRLDLLLHDEQLNRRYEVELMLGPTDPSHIIRCVEYWDIERRRYPAYDHVAVLVAEDITSRFLNVIGLMSGNIPLIAIQFAALKVDTKVILHFVHVLDQTALRSDDEYESGGSEGVMTNREYWEKKVPSQSLVSCDWVVEEVNKLSGEPHRLSYRKRIIDILPADNGDARIWIIPKKTLVRVGGYVDNPEEWVKHLEEAGQVASLKRGNTAVLASYKLGELQSPNSLLSDFIRSALNLDDRPISGSTSDISESQV